MDSTQTATAATPPLAVPRGALLSLPRIDTRRDTVPAVLIALAVIAIVVVDLPLAALAKRGGLPDGLDKFLEAAEHFGTFYGHVIAFLLIGALDPAHRRHIVRIAAAAWSAGLAANLVKLVIARTRPKYFDFNSLTAGHGFLGFAPGLPGGSRIQGFPSAHTATAVAFCVALSSVYPRGRNVFTLLAILVGLQRIATSSHFASDILVGACIGWLVGHAFTGRNRLTNRLDTFEAAST
jgi:membrane-associated phospholipid phosphatase